MKFGKFVQHTNPLNKHFWYFLIPPSGPASGSKRCWKMETWGPGVHSFEAFHMISGYFVQYASPLKRHYWYFMIQPSGPPSGSRRCCNVECWGPNIHSFEAISMNFGYFVQYTSPLNRHYWYFAISPSRPASGRRCYIIEFWGNSFEDFYIILGYFVQYTSPLKRHCWYRLTSPSGLASGLRRSCKMNSSGRGIQSFSSYWIQHFQIPGRRPGDIL